MVQPLIAQLPGADLGGAGLRQHAGRGAEFGLGLLGLQLQVDFIEGRERLADIDGLADLDQTFGDLAGDPEAHVGLDPRTDGADEAALRRLGFIMRGGDQNRSRRLGLLGDRIVAAGQGNAPPRPAIRLLTAWNSLIKSTGPASNTPRCSCE